MTFIDMYKLYSNFVVIFMNDISTYFYLLTDFKFVQYVFDEFDV